MDKYFYKLDNFWVRLLLIIMYWCSFIGYQIIRGINVDQFNTFGFIYSCILFVPLTLFILLDKFHISFILIIILMGMETLTSAGTVVKYFNALGSEENLDLSIFTVISSVVSLGLAVSVIILAITKMRRDIKVVQWSNKYAIMHMVVLTLLIIKVGCSIYNLAEMVKNITNSLEISEKVLSMIYNTVLLCYEGVYVLAARKKEYLTETD